MWWLVALSVSASTSLGVRALGSYCPFGLLHPWILVPLALIVHLGFYLLDISAPGSYCPCGFLPPSVDISAPGSYCPFGLLRTSLYVSALGSYCPIGLQCTYHISHQDNQDINVMYIGVHVYVCMYSTNCIWLM